MTHEDSKPDSSCQPKSLVVRVSDSNRGSEPVEDGGQIKDSEHFHTVSRYGELFLYNRNLAMTQRGGIGTCVAVDGGVGPVPPE